MGGLVLSSCQYFLNNLVVYVRMMRARVLDIWFGVYGDAVVALRKSGKVLGNMPSAAALLSQLMMSLKGLDELSKLVRSCVAPAYALYCVSSCEAGGLGSQNFHSEGYGEAHASTKWSSGTPLVRRMSAFSLDGWGVAQRN